MALVSLFALGVWARFWHLDDLPSPGGDECHWARVAWRMSQGEAADLPAEARFVTPVFGQLLAWSITCFEPSFASMRLVPTLASISGAALVLGFCVFCGSPRLGMVLAALLLLHPWAVMWSRVIFAPYVFTLVLGVLGPLAWLAALPTRGWKQVLALATAGQLLVAGLHFSPLAAIPIVACGLWTCRPALLKSASPWLALVLMALHAWPIVMPALKIAQGLQVLLPDTENSPSEKLTRYALATLDIFSGEATVRHFSNASLRGMFIHGVRAVCLLVLLGGLASACWPRRQTGTSTPRVDDELGRFAVLYLLVALIGVPVLVSFGRDWSYFMIDSERYGFAVLAPVFLLAGVTATRSTASLAVVLAAVILCGLVPTGRVLGALAYGGGPSSGLWNFAGGGWNIWRAAQGPRAAPEVVWQILSEQASKQPVTLVLADFSAKEHAALQFKIAVSGHQDIRVEPLYPSWYIDETGKKQQTGKYYWPPRPHLETGSRVVAMVWSDDLFHPGYRPNVLPYRNARSRDSFKANFKNVRLLRTIVQPDGSSLLELWDGECTSDSPGSEVRMTIDKPAR